MWKQARSNYGAQVLRKRILKTVSMVFLFAVVGSALAWGLYKGFDFFAGDRNKLQGLWAKGDYPGAYAFGKEALQKRPLDPFTLTVFGFASYQLAGAQITAREVGVYLDDCIWALRKVIIQSSLSVDPRLYYVLGKAYYHKGPLYADLAVTYLEKARKAGFTAEDLAEYLGLSYAGIRDYRNSVVAFSQALEVTAKNPSDLLLLAIAKSYLALSEKDSAKAYLMRCIDSSRDAKIIVQARLLLGTLLASQGDSSGAEAQYTAVIAMDDQNADAHFQLGELYNSAGDPIKARSEWRKTVKIDPTYGPARARLSL